MILRTTVEWTQDKKISPEDLEKLKAKQEVLGRDYNPMEDQHLLYEETVKNAIIDTDSDKIYVEISANRICMTRLLDAQYICDSENVIQTVTEKLYFESTLEEIEEALKTKKQKKIKKWQ